MGRKAKYSKAVKLKAIDDYINGKKSASQLSNEIGFEVNTLYIWVKSYQELGESIFDDKPQNSSYTKEFKLKVVKEYLNGEGSLSDLTIRNKIFGKETLRKWVMMYMLMSMIKLPFLSARDSPILDIFSSSFFL